MSNPNDLKGFGNAKGNEWDNSFASPDAMVMPKGSNNYYRDKKAAAARQEKRDAKKQERKKKIRRFRRFMGGTAIAALSAGVILLADREPNKPMEREAWEATMEKDTSGHNATISYGENGSTISLKEQHSGVPTDYTFFDNDNDTYIEKAHSSNSQGGADAEFSEPMTFKGALQLINTKMDANN